MTPLPPCPKCGDTEDGFIVNARICGPAMFSYLPDGRYVESFSEFSEITRYGAVLCGKCERRRQDLTVDKDHNRVVLRKGGAVGG